jgi:alkanesulfonate monooxygenase SsuD/methylene tetrahydromethanopterin reductase-like flavin-dependent oxidoreductase (luciferase family)
MRLGLHALGIGAGARRTVLDAVARAAKAADFCTLWAGEHVVMVDRPSSRYPYTADGQMPVPAESDWLDPFVCLSFIAAATRSITVATGVLLLPEHNALLVAKQAASPDVLSAGRLVLRPLRWFRRGSPLPRRRTTTRPDRGNRLGSRPRPPLGAPSARAGTSSVTTGR